MQLFGATYIMWIERLMAGISHQHVLSYNPRIRETVTGRIKKKAIHYLCSVRLSFFVFFPEITGKGNEVP